jgi:hypothetical protein
VAIVLVLLPASDDRPLLQPAALATLARLGVTSVSLLRDEETTGLVLEGWALDPARAAEAANAVAGARDRVRTLQPLMQMAISANPVEEPTQTKGA